MDFQKSIKEFSQLGKILHDYLSGKHSGLRFSTDTLADAVKFSNIHNSWFTDHNILFALRSVTSWLNSDVLEQWLSRYKNQMAQKTKTSVVGVIMAGNVPLVGFHDFLCVMLSGNNIIIKPSSSDKYLMPALAEILYHINPEYRKRIRFCHEELKDFDAVIATGSNNTSRYFEYYFDKYPHIIRKNRNSLAVIQGNETTEELKALSTDMFMYFGLGCRNVSALLLPENYDFSLLIEAAEKYEYLKNHAKYFRNYEYYKAIEIIDKRKFTDGGFFILEQNDTLSSPLSVVHYRFYKSLSDADAFIESHKDQIQCVVSKLSHPLPSVAFGMSQKPAPGDYADGIDTMNFLLQI